VTKEGTRGCKVQSGSHLDEYTGSTAPFVSGQDTSPLVQIDHVVALSNAWQTGAQQLDLPTRTALANDPLNLQAVAGAVNQEKGDGDAATWLPPRKGYRCTYIARQIAVKAKYGLWVTQAEHDAMTRVLGNCDSAESDAAARPETVPTDRGGTYFANCAAARAADAAPPTRGTPRIPGRDGRRRRRRRLRIQLNTFPIVSTIVEVSVNHAMELLLDSRLNPR
jgi:hypothetical protein